MANSGSLLLSIRSPCLAENGEVEAQLDWTVLRVKEEISGQWADHPRPDDQRLIHAGKLLENSSLLRDVLRLDEDLTHYTVYLVRRQTMAAAATPRPPQSPAASGGLRKRNVAQPAAAQAQSQQPSDVAAAADQWQAYLQQFATHEANSEQHANVMMQHAYAHYMNQYMQFWNYHSTTPAHGGVGNSPQQQAMAFFPHHDQLMHGAGLEPVAAAAAAAAAVVGQPAPHTLNPPAHQPAAPQMGNNLNGGGARGGDGGAGGNAIMNAGAVGAMEEDDGEFEGGQRDALDWIYLTMRVVVLFSIVYFYSSLTRFVLVVGFGLAIYMYRLGLFGTLGGAGGGDRINQEAGREDVGNDDGNPDRGREDESSENNDIAGPAENAEPRQTWSSVALTFVTTFFTSLMPNDTQAV